LVTADRRLNIAHITNTKVSILYWVVVGRHWLISQ